MMINPQILPEKGARVSMPASLSPGISGDYPSYSHKREHSPRQEAICSRSI